MDIKSFDGKPLFAVIDEICRGVTDADRWAIFQGCIELSEHQVISIGGDFMRFGIRIIGGPEPQKAKSEIDAEAYAAALRPLFEELVSCTLVARCRPIAPASGGQEFDFPGDGWEDPWKLIIEAKRATLVDEAGNKHKVLSLRLGSEAHPAMQATAAEPAATKPAKKGNAGGRPLKFPWALFERELGKKLFDDGIPERGDGGQARLEEWAKDWFEGHCPADKQPDGSTIKKKVRAALETYRAGLSVGEKPQLFPKLPDKQR